MGKQLAQIQFENDYQRFPLPLRNVLIQDIETVGSNDLCLHFAFTGSRGKSWYEKGQRCHASLVALFQCTLVCKNADVMKGAKELSDPVRLSIQQPSFWRKHYTVLLDNERVTMQIHCKAVQSKEISIYIRSGDDWIPKMTSAELEALRTSFDYVGFFRPRRQFLTDLIHLHYYDTPGYYTDSGFAARIPLAVGLKLLMNVLPWATKASKVEGRYKFEYKSGSLPGIPIMIPFPELHNNLVAHCYGTRDVDHLHSSMYQSGRPCLIKLAEQLSERPVQLSQELWEFVNQKENDPEFSYSIEDLCVNNWDYALLALNKRLWQKIFSNVLDDSLIKRVEGHV